MTKVKKPKMTKADFQRKVAETEAQLASTYHFADVQVLKAGQEHLMASAVVLRLTALGGREIIPPVAIKDGLSSETINAIRADLRRSYDLATMFKPVGVE